MQLRPLELDGAFEITADAHRDDRGSFQRVYDRDIFAEQGLVTEWAQESVSHNVRANTLRGLHFQRPPHAETKIVRVLHGAALDVMVDLRGNSATYGRWLVIELSAAAGNAVYIPAGFAHGFRTLADDTVMLYKIDVSYQADLSGGIAWDDRTLKISWGGGQPLVSERDRQLPPMSEFDSPFN
jgi:dTDP-4-dehydrorhamnose 3,5-epimerase